MAVPCFVRRHCNCLLVGVIALTGLGAAETWPAFGQSRGQDRQIAPFDRMPLGGPAEGPAVASPPTVAPSAERAINPTDTAAARLLAAARQDLAQGNAELAQRVLEQLVARYPDSALVDEARHELYAIYTGLRGTAQRPPAVSAAPSPALSGWRTTVVHFAKPQEELRNGIGDRVFFSAGSAELGSRARAVLSAQAEWLGRRPDLDVVVEGHADDADAGADDEKLAASRAIAVRDRLAAEGVAPARIRIVPHGARDPIASCDDGSCAAQNRRAVVQVAIRRSQPPDNSLDAVGQAAGSDGRPR